MAFIRVFIFVSASLIGRWLDNYVCEGGCGVDLRVSGAVKVNRREGLYSCFKSSFPQKDPVSYSPNHLQPARKKPSRFCGEIQAKGRVIPDVVSV